MKKLMTIMAMVAMASMLHAGALTWGATGSGYGYTGEDPDAEAGWFTGGQAYLVFIENSITFDVSNIEGIGWTITGGKIVGWSGMEWGEAGGTVNSAESFLGSVASTPSFVIIFTTEGPGAGPSGLPTEGLWGVSAPQQGVWDGNVGVFGMTQAVQMGNIVYIPEPATALLALAGIGLLIAQKRKRA